MISSQRKEQIQETLHTLLSLYKFKHSTLQYCLGKIFPGVEAAEVIDSFLRNNMASKGVLKTIELTESFKEKYRSVFFDYIKQQLADKVQKGETFFMHYLLCEEIKLNKNGKYPRLKNSCIADLVAETFFEDESDHAYVYNMFINKKGTDERILRNIGLYDLRKFYTLLKTPYINKFEELLRNTNKKDYNSPAISDIPLVYLKLKKLHPHLLRHELVKMVADETKFARSTVSIYIYKTPKVLEQS